jgi:hypothetical protein
VRRDEVERSRNVGRSVGLDEAVPHSADV